MAHRGRLLEGDADTAARGVFDGLFGLVVEVVALQAVTGRSQGGEMGAGTRATHLSDSRTWPRSTRGARWGAASLGVGMGKCVRVCALASENVFGKGTCSLSDTG